MTPSELAEQLSRLMGLALASEESMYPESADSVLDSYEDLCRSNSEIIVKCLRFAADMEVLQSEGHRPTFYVSVDFEKNQGKVKLSVITKIGICVPFFARDIYSAARNAVEKLEGKL